jgi:hypothetical protein
MISSSLYTSGVSSEAEVAATIVMMYSCPSLFRRLTGLFEIESVRCPDDDPGEEIALEGMAKGDARRAEREGRENLYGIEA